MPLGAFALGLLEISVVFGVFQVFFQGFFPETKCFLGLGFRVED